MTKSRLTPFLVIAAALVLAVVLNPSAEKHRTTIKEAIAERSPLQALLGVGALTAFVSEYHSLGVASYTRVNDRLVSVGAFGLVFLVD